MVSPERLLQIAKNSRNNFRAHASYMKEMGARSRFPTLILSGCTWLVVLFVTVVVVDDAGADLVANRSASALLPASFPVLPMGTIRQRLRFHMRHTATREASWSAPVLWRFGFFQGSIGKLPRTLLQFVASLGRESLVRIADAFFSVVARAALSGGIERSRPCN